MSAEGARDALTRFFTKWGGASLELPSGWFGRPFDNVHELTAASVAGDTLVIELDDRLVLSVDNPTEVSIHGPRLRIAGFKQALWQWSEYGSARQHEEQFREGSLEFVAHE